MMEAVVAALKRREHIITDNAAEKVTVMHEVGEGRFVQVKVDKLNGGKVTVTIFNRREALELAAFIYREQ